MTWQLLYEGNHQWRAYFGARHMATLAVVVTLEHESAAMARIAEALNKQHLDTPARTWTARQVGHCSWDLQHNGRDAIGIIWHTEREDIAKGIERVLEGLNATPARSMPAAEPARPRHLRLVS